ncbi:MAG: lytic murein transglycosylase [Marinosulfonomonas sp.]|nr:lytic murein transglycosylase [Marinosulfonomonas sp.]
MTVFAIWIAEFREKALQSGISGVVLDQAFAEVSLNATVLEKDRNQPEHVTPIWDYLDRAVSKPRVDGARQALRDNLDLISSIEAKFGVEKEFLVAIWGLESNFGALRGNYPVIEALATLAYDGRRRALFEGQLLAALRIVQSGDIAAENLVGSWAGAMGHTQFMPTSYLDHAVDFDGDGRRDIWADDPADALASTAAYLAAKGWTHGLGWGGEVMLAKGFDYALANDIIAKTTKDWRRAGVTAVRSSEIPMDKLATLIAPAGARGPAFLVSQNFQTVLRYNNAQPYALAVCSLADRAAGDDATDIDWPRTDKALSPAQIKELQEILVRLNYTSDAADGMLGPQTSAAIRAYQKASGRPADGYASFELLQKLRGLDAG